MERVLRGLHWLTLLLYLDDIIVVGPDFQTQGTARGEYYCISVIFQKEVQYFDHIVSLRQECPQILSKLLLLQNGVYSGALLNNQPSL